MEVKRAISLITALCSCLLISASVAAQTTETETIEVLSHDYITGNDTSFVFSSNNSDVYSSTKNTPAYFPNISMEDSGILPNVIIGQDNRIMVDPNVYPYSAIVCLDYGIDTNNDGIIDDWRMGSGFVTSKNVVVTAGHCLYKTSGWVEGMRVHYNQSGVHLNDTWSEPQSMSVSATYATGFDYRFDWGIIVLQDNIGYTTGWFGIGTTEGTLDNKMITAAGYPNDRPYFQYIATDTIYGCDEYTCCYRADVDNGQSGGPVYDINNTVWAINIKENNNLNFNRGARITKVLFDLITSYY